VDTAGEWRAKVDTWTYTAAGHYEWLDDNGNPNDGHILRTIYGGVNTDERQLLDSTAFLELVRLGVKSPNDPHITSTLHAVDTTLRLGDQFYRRSKDGYGETATGGSPFTGNGIGRLWPLLSGERGEYELIAGHRDQAAVQLNAMASPEGLISEQVWDAGPDSGRPTGSARPLGWAQAQYVLLASSLAAGHDLAMPRLVKERYQR